MTKTSSDQHKNNKNHSKISGELAAKISLGDIAVKNEFVQINYRWLLFIVRRKFAQSNNHEDIVQDTFMLVLNKLQQGKVNNHKAIMGFLRTTAINIGYEYLRKDKKFTSAIDQNFLDAIEDSKQDILSSIIWDDKVKYVKLVMDELKKQRDKDILIKFYFKDQNKLSICDELDLSSEHFDRVLCRAKQRLKQLIEKKGDNNPNNSLESSNNYKQRIKSSQITMREIYQYMKCKVGLPTIKLMVSLVKLKLFTPKTTGASA